MPTAVKINDPINYPEKLRRRLGVVKGERYYRVQASSVDHALLADGLPAEGSPWSPQFLLVELVEVIPRAEQPGGDWWILTLVYETNTGVEHVPEDGLELVTEIEQVSTTERVYADITGAHRIGKDGQGVPKLVTATNYKVMTYSETFPDLDALQRISNDPKVNTNPVILRNLLGSEESVLVPAGELLYATFAIAKVGELYRVTHFVQQRDSWKHLQDKADLAGDPTGEADERDLYETIDFVAAFGAG